MKSIKKITAVVCIFALIVSFFVTASAYDRQYTPETLTQVKSATDDKCIAYSLVSAAEDYAVKVLGAKPDGIPFSEENFIKKLGSSSNYGEVLYSAPGYSLGNGYYITEVESLTDRGERYIKHKIKENGSVIAAINLPAGGMTDDNCYDKTENGDATFFCAKNKRSENLNHAFTIIGWDDEYDCSNFKSNPGINGAWLCKNNQGTEYGKDGYFLLSYGYDFLFASAVKISRLDKLKSVRTGDKSLLTLKFISALGIRTNNGLRNAQIKVTINGKDEINLTCDLVNGYNFVSLGKKLLTGEAKVTVNGTELGKSSFNCYMVSGRNDELIQSSPKPEENWEEKIDRVEINLGEETYTAYSEADGRTINHDVKLNSHNNTFYITPEDGFFFDENTTVSLIRYEHHSHFSVNLGEKAVKDFTDDDGVSLEDGKLKIKSMNIGGAFANGIDISLDDDGKIKEVYLIEDNGSKFRIEPETTLLDVPGGNEIKDISGLDSYCAVLSFSDRYITEDFKVTINGEDAGIFADVAAEGKDVTVSVVIEIPSVTNTFYQSMAIILGIFASMLSGLMNIINK